MMSPDAREFAKFIRDSIRCELGAEVVTSTDYDSLSSEVSIESQRAVVLEDVGLIYSGVRLNVRSRVVDCSNWTGW